MRLLTPELLDLLPPDDPRALRSRRDLVWINWVMRQRFVMARVLATFPAPRILIDLGGGDGRFVLGVAKLLANHWRGVRVVIADRQDIVIPETRAAFKNLGWTCENLVGDVFEALSVQDVDIVIANLVLHHFDDMALARLLAASAARTKAFVACEPRRSRFALLGAHLVGVLGVNDVTRHDAIASVRAGFTDQEISMLWPSSDWVMFERAAFPFTHVFMANHV